MSLSHFLTDIRLFFFYFYYITLYSLHCVRFYIKSYFCYYFRKGGDVIASVCLSVGKISHKVVEEFLWTL